MAKGKKVTEKLKRSIINTMLENEADPTTYLMTPERIAKMYGVSSWTVKKIKRDYNRETGHVSPRQHGYWLPESSTLMWQRIKELKANGKMDPDWQPAPPRRPIKRGGMGLAKRGRKKTKF